MTQTYILITGGNRGLGLGLVEKFLSLPNHTVVSANRDPNHSTSKALAGLPKADGSKVLVVRYDAGVEQDAFDLVKELEEKYEINQLDIVVANAGIAKSYPLVKDVERSDIQEHININAYGMVSLYQATRDLLYKSTNNPAFVTIGSGAGSLGQQPPIPNSAYGPSKAIVNWYGVRINAEDEWLTAFVLIPGFVQTDMGNYAAQHFGIGEAPLTIEESVGGLFKVITTATKEKYGGKTVLYTGEIQDF